MSSSGRVASSGSLQGCGVLFRCLARGASTLGVEVVGEGVEQPDVGGDGGFGRNGALLGAV